MDSVVPNIVSDFKTFRVLKKLSMFAHYRFSVIDSVKTLCAFDIYKYKNWVNTGKYNSWEFSGGHPTIARNRNLMLCFGWLGFVFPWTNAVFFFQPWKVAFFFEKKHPIAAFISQFIPLDPEFYRVILFYSSQNSVGNPYFRIFKKYVKTFIINPSHTICVYCWQLDILFRTHWAFMQSFVLKKVGLAPDPYTFFDSRIYVDFQRIAFLYPSNQNVMRFITSLPFTGQLFFSNDKEAYFSKSSFFLVQDDILLKIPTAPIFVFYLRLLTLLPFSRVFTFFYIFAKKTLLPLLVSTLFIIFSFIFFKLSLFRVGSGWLVIFFFIFWLLSGFNYFLKHYRFGKYTSANQRFWRRALMCFWFVEGFLFVIFLYYALNASAEPLFMFDQVGFYSRQLQFINNFLVNAFLIISVINLLIYLLIMVKFTTHRQSSVFFLLITLVLVYVLLLESYQFYYLTNYYDDSYWVFSEDDLVWGLEFEIPRARNKNHYMTLIILAKFWHYIFIFASWVFFVMKSLELRRSRYALLSMNLQNLIIFYVMNWVCLYSWLKWILRRFMNQQYYWFFSSFRPTTTHIIISDIVNLGNQAFSYIFSSFNFFNFKNPNLMPYFVNFLDVFSSGSKVSFVLSVLL